MENQFLETGEVVSTHGVRGELKVLPWADAPEFLLQFRSLRVGVIKESFEDITNPVVKANAGVVLETLRKLGLTATPSRRDGVGGLNWDPCDTRSTVIGIWEPCWKPTANTGGHAANSTFAKRRSRTAMST